MNRKNAISIALWGIWLVVLFSFIALSEQGLVYEYLGEWGEPLIIIILVLLPMLPFLPMIVQAFGFMFGMGHPFLMDNDESRRISETGRPARATVLGIGESSSGGVMTINDQPYVNLRFRIEDAKRTPYEVSFDTVIPRTAVPQFQPGAVFMVKVDATDPQKFVLDSGQAPGGSWASSVHVGAEWTERDRKLVDERGKDGIMEILAVEDTGRSRDFSLLVRLKCSVEAPGLGKYVVDRELPLTTEAVRALRSMAGSRVPVRIHPEDRKRIMFSMPPG